MINYKFIGSNAQSKFKLDEVNNVLRALALFFNLYFVWVFVDFPFVDK